LGCNAPKRVRDRAIYSVELKLDTIIQMIKKQKTRICITGGCGFVGHHFVEALLKETKWEIIVLDSLNYSGNQNRLTDIECFDTKRIKYVYHNLQAPISETIHKMLGRLDYIVHLASETHVDNSLKDSIPFVMSNVLGTANLFEYLKKKQKKVKKIISFNTDEVFGPAPKGIYYKEYDRFTPSNPYSAAKAGQAALDYAFYNSFNLPIITTFTMNIIGERQHPEKFLPTIMRKIIKNEKVPLFGNNKNDISYRHWIHARNVADAVMFLLKKGKVGERYNIVGEEASIRKVARFIYKTIKGEEMKESDIDYVGFTAVRPGHDRRYSLNGEKMKEMGWNPPMNLWSSIIRIVEWSTKKKNKDWLNL